MSDLQLIPRTYDGIWISQSSVDFGDLLRRQNDRGNDFRDLERRTISLYVAADHFEMVLNVIFLL